MRKTLLLLTIGAFAIQCFGSETNFSLEIEAGARTVRLGSSVSIELHLINSGAALTGLKELSDGMSSIPDFLTVFSIRPSKEGEFLVGPYELLSAVG